MTTKNIIYKKLPFAIGPGMIVHQGTAKFENEKGIMEAVITVYEDIQFDHSDFISFTVRNLDKTFVRVIITSNGSIDVTRE